MVGLSSCLAERISSVISSAERGSSYQPPLDIALNGCFPACCADWIFRSISINESVSVITNFLSYELLFIILTSIPMAEIIR